MISNISSCFRHLHGQKVDTKRKIEETLETKGPPRIDPQLCIVDTRLIK